MRIATLQERLPARSAEPESTHGSTPAMWNQEQLASLRCAGARPRGRDVLVLSEETSGSPDLKKAFEFAITTPRFENRVITVERRAPSQGPFRYPWILRDLPFIKEAQDPQRTAEKILKFLKTAA